MTKKKEEPIIVPAERTAIAFETIFGNKVQLFVDNIEEMIWYPAGIADIYTVRMHYFVKMDAQGFERLLELRGKQNEKDTI